MREMKDSGVRWIGKIPTKWTIAKAKNCVEIQNGSDPKTEGSIPVYGSGSMSFKTCGEYKEGPSVLIGRKGATLHIPHYISSKFWNVDTAFNVYSKSIFDLKYYFYCAHVFDYTLYMSQTTLPSMTQTAYENMFLPLPTKEEQYAIANQLDQICSKIDTVLEKTRASIEEYKKLKQAVITQAVTKGVRGDRPMKNSGIEWIGDIPAEWSVVPFSKFARVSANLVNPSDYQDYLQVSPENIEKDSGKLLPCKTVSEVGVESWNHFFHKGQILYSKIRPKLNKVCIAPFDGLCSADMYPIDTDNVSKFVMYTILSNGFNQQVSMITENRVKMPKINQKELSKLIVVMPKDYSEQQEVVDYLEDRCVKIDTLITQKQQYLTEIENYKKSLIYEYVTGKKEVV